MVFVCGARIPRHIREKVTHEVTGQFASIHISQKNDKSPLSTTYTPFERLLEPLQYENVQFPLLLLV